MIALKPIAAVLAVALAGLAHAEKLANWKIEGHLTAIEVSADPLYADFWSKLAVGQDYEINFKVDLDALPVMNIGYVPARTSTLEFKQAGFKFQLDFLNSGIWVYSQVLDFGSGYGSFVSGAPQAPAGAAYSFNDGFPGTIGSKPGQSPTLWDINAAINAGSLTLRPIFFGFVDGSLMNLGTYINASVDRLTSSVVPEVDALVMALAGGLPCVAAMAVRRRRLNARV